MPLGLATQTAATLSSSLAILLSQGLDPFTFSFPLVTRPTRRLGIVWVECCGVVAWNAKGGKVYLVIHLRGVADAHTRDGDAAAMAVTAEDGFVELA